jgi:hypothetical protein
MAVTARWKRLPYDSSHVAGSIRCYHRNLIHKNSTEEGRRQHLGALTRVPLTPSLMYYLLSAQEILRIQQWTDDLFGALLEQEPIRRPCISDESTA